MPRAIPPIEPTDNLFRRLRKQAKLSQEGLAGKIDVAVSTIRRWERGDNEPTMTRRQIGNFCQAIGIEFDELPESLIRSPQSS